MTALFFGNDEVTRFEFGQMRTRGLRRDAGFLRKFGRGERAATHQRRQHVGSRGIADKRCDHGHVRSCFHTSTLIEAFAAGNG